MCKYCVAENFGKLQAKLHLVKKTLMNLSPVSIAFSDMYYKQLADKTLANP